ncbi:MAG: hypothetical protein LC794_04395 [Acidobacteria bacterium]|nr:hypothetical protein [Acidobacteriota bacterium]
MKSCPKCNRTFPDDGQKFCTFDGGLLISPQTFDPNATMRATSIDLNSASERPTSRDLPDQSATLIEDYPATVALPRNTGPTGQTTTVSGPDTADFTKPAPPPPPPPVSPAPPVETSSSAVTGPVAPTVAPPTPAAPSSSAPLPPAAARKKSKLPWIIAGVLLFLLLGGGAIAAAFFLVVKPRLDEMAGGRSVNENRPVVTTNTNTATPEPTIEQPSPTPQDTFVPPPNAVQFTNSNDGLEGALAEHYFDFSFYYPQTWQRIRNPSAANFAEVERRIPPNLTQENFVVGWYTSKGTFVADLPSYPKRVEEFSTRLSTQFPEYRKVSEGPTKINKMDGYEFRWEGLSQGTERGDVHLWGRVIFVPTGNEGDTTGATLILFTTSLAPELSSVEDVGTKGEAPVILDSFRFGKKQ